MDENFLVELMVALRRVDTYTYDRLCRCFIIPEMAKKDMLALLDILIKHDAKFELSKRGLVIYV